MTFVPAWKRLGLQLKNAPATQNNISEQVQYKNAANASADAANGKRKASLDATLSGDRRIDKSRVKKQKLSEPSPKPAKITFQDDGEKRDDPSSKGEKENAAPSAEENASLAKPVTKPKSILKNPLPAHPKPATKPQQPKIEQQAKTNAYLSYLRQFHEDKSHWKFNKSQQINLLKNAFNTERIPSEYEDALGEYIKGLQGGAARQRLREDAEKILAEPVEDSAEPTGDPEKPAEDAQTQPITEDAESDDESPEDDMDRPEHRKRAKKQALKRSAAGVVKVAKEYFEARSEVAHRRKYQSRKRAEMVLTWLRDSIPDQEARRRSDARFNLQVAQVQARQTHEAEARENMAGAMKKAIIGGATVNQDGGVQKRERGTRGRKRRTQFVTGVPEDDEMSASSSDSSSSSSSEDESDSGSDGVSDTGMESEDAGSGPERPPGQK